MVVQLEPCCPGTRTVTWGPPLAARECRGSHDDPRHEREQQEVLDWDHPKQGHPVGWCRTLCIPLRTLELIAAEQRHPVAPQEVRIEERTVTEVVEPVSYADRAEAERTRSSVAPCRRLCEHWPDIPRAAVVDDQELHLI